LVLLLGLGVKYGRLPLDGDLHGDRRPGLERDVVPIVVAAS
jgi:hypothetical protein